LDVTFCSQSETTESSSESQKLSSSDLGRRFKLNSFLQECNLQPIERPWLDWEQASERTKHRYVGRAAEVVSSTLNVIYPNAAIHLWKELQTSNKVNVHLGAAATVSTPNSYLEALAESYNIAEGWDTRRQILSIMTGVVSFLEISLYIPGLTQYRHTVANTHRLQHGRAAPVVKTSAPRIRVNKQQLDHFLCFITSPHLVQDLPFGEVKLTLTSGQIIQVPNVIRTMVPQRIVNQYKEYCKERESTPLHERTLLRILTECSASVRKSLQGLDTFAAEGGKAFDDLLDLLETLSTHGAEQGKVAALRESLKSGKLYLKGDYKVQNYKSIPNDDDDDDNDDDDDDRNDVVAPIICK